MKLILGCLAFIIKVLYENKMISKTDFDFWDFSLKNASTEYEVKK